MMKFLCLFSLLLVSSLSAQRVGASLSLEGRASVLRAADVLRQQQSPDGFWRQSPELTALCTCALHATQAYLQDAAMGLAVGKALSALRQTLRHHSPRQLAMTMRPLLLIQDEADNPLLKQALKHLLESHAPAPTPDSPWELDTALLAAQRLAVPLPPDCRQRHAEHLPQSRAQQLALAILCGNANDYVLQTLVPYLRKQSCQNLSIEDLYWAARSLQACNKTGLLPYDGWKADIMSALLDRQRGNGTWARRIPDFLTQPTAEDLRNTALAVQIAILCLMD